MSLLGSLWGDSGNGGGGGGAKGDSSSGGPVCKQEKMSYAQVASYSSSGESSQSKRASKGSGSCLPAKQPQLSGAKRPRSPKAASCGCCFRTTHGTVECRHQIVCLRCACVGHMAARCPVENRRSPHRKKVHVRTKCVGSQVGSLAKLHSDEGGLPLGGSRDQKLTRTSLSIPLPPESGGLREDLAKVAVLSLVEDQANESNLLDVIPSVLNMSLAGPITSVNECTFLIPLASREEVKELCKMGKFKVRTKDGPCELLLAPWSAKLGAIARASGEGQWVLIWNLPLHAWSWSVIAEVLRPVGELVALSQAALPHKQFLSVLVRRRLGVSLPLEQDFSMGMRHY